jgi:anti-anti-sigma factor
MLTVEKNIPENRLTIAVDGDFDAEVAGKARDQFEEIVADWSGDVTIDLFKTEFLDSSGIGAIVYLFKRLNARNQGFLLSHASGQPKELIEMLRIDRAIPVTFLNESLSA